MIIVDQLWPHYLKSQDYSKMAEFGITISKTGSEVRNNPENFVISWGDSVHQTRCAMIETGFFWDGIHIDSMGLYENASFNFPMARGIIESYDAKVSFSEMQKRGLTMSKFRQSHEKVEWDGIVIAAQHPGDRSIWKAGSTGDYHKFLDEACSYYKGKAFIKLHPVVMGNASELEIVRGIANKHGSQCGHVDISIVDKAEFVLVYNSTFVVDAIAAGKHVVQYAPGYFWQSGVTQYTGRLIPSRIQECDKSYKSKFLDFLVWKYCFHKMTNLGKIADIVKVFASSKELFPLPDELSFASFVLGRILI
jgi:hypothetical protein